VIPPIQLNARGGGSGSRYTYLMKNFPTGAPERVKEVTMKARALIASAAVVFLCGGFGVCFAAEGSTPETPAASAPSPAPESAPAPAPKAKHHRMHRRHGKHHAQKEYTEQELQQYQSQPPAK
jgi:hypothetical protein